uniref:Uncharacterized protein n=1 Tax=Alexandrium catenella TaxID=2925 RepID=A0A7S1M830_ALECA
MVRETVDELDGFCKGDAQEAFHAVADQIDLSPLCRIGDTAGIKTELVKAVNGRVGSVRESIEKVKTWMDPFKGQEGITQTQVAEFVAKGEPEGLRRVMGVYSTAGFFQYLKGWEVRGDFLGRIAKLKQVIDALDSSVTALAGELKTFKDQYSATTTLREEAEKKLEKAVQVHGLAQGSKDKVESQLAEMRGRDGKLKQSIEELERAVELALKNWAAAKQMMVDAYSKATSFLELLPEGEPSALLEAKTARAQQQVAILRDELESARTARTAIRAKMAAAKAF